MLGRLPYKTKQFFIVVIKLSIIIGASYYIYNRLLKNESLDFNEFSRFLSKNESFSVKNIIFLLVLSTFNWFFEILKWQKLVSSIKKISFKDAMQQSLGGLTASLITPNRIGDYGAKAIYFDKPLRKRILLLNLLGNMSQMAVTTIIGCVGLIVFQSRYNIEVDSYKLSRFFIIIIVMIVFATLGLKQSRFKIKGFSIDRVLQFIKKLSTKIHIQNFGLSLIRYAIFSFQFYFLLSLFNTNLDYKTAIVAISSMYLLASIVPSLVIFDVVIKTSAAVFLFDYLGVDAFTILSITTLMWLLNFILPSLIGSYYVLTFNASKTKN
jgi:uncharacterized membrane protein YbhN (UPF0104 family)